MGGQRPGDGRRTRGGRNKGSAQGNPEGVQGVIETKEEEGRRTGAVPKKYIRTDVDKRVEIADDSNFSLD